MPQQTTQDSTARRDVGTTAAGRSYLWIYAFTIPALLGYWMYGLHPERLAGSDLALRIYPFTFPWFARLHILVGATVLFIALFKALRASWIPAFTAVALLSFTAEHVGTGYGVPFGGYGYTGLLGLKVGGRVPALIPVSWFLMALLFVGGIMNLYWIVGLAAFVALEKLTPHGVLISRIAGAGLIARQCDKNRPASNARSVGWFAYGPIVMMGLVEPTQR